MSDPFDTLIGPLLAREGGYSHDPRDAGGETNWGVTAVVAHANGYAGSMISMTRDDAAKIYRAVYWQRPGFAMLSEQAPDIAAELFDCGVNMGVGTASIFFQRCLNVFNRQAVDYPDLKVDGQIGAATLNALQAFIGKRNAAGLKVLLAALRCLRGARYVELAESRAQNEAFVYGWIANRVAV